MSEHNYFGLTVRAQMEKDPSVFSLDGLDEKLKETQKKIAAVDAANKLQRDTTTGVNSPKAIHNRLRKELYDLQEYTKATETKVNNEADNVREFQNRVEVLCEAKKAAIAAGQLGKERNIEHRIEMVEDELLDSREKLTRIQKDNHRAVRALKDWKKTNGAEFERIAKEIG